MEAKKTSESLAKLIRQRAISSGTTVKHAAIGMTVAMIEDVVMPAIDECVGSSVGERVDTSVNIAVNFLAIRITEAALEDGLTPSQVLDFIIGITEAVVDSCFKRIIEEKRSNGELDEERVSEFKSMADDIIRKAMH